MRKLSSIIPVSVREGVSDIHITGEHPLVLRKNGQIRQERSIKWTHNEVDALVKKLLTPRQILILRREWSVDLAVTIQHVRLRLNVFNTTRGLSLAIRLLPGVIPTIQRLNLHPSLQQIAELPAGLVLICGATGTGKSTTIAAIIDEINRTRSAHIITLEDPIEYRFTSKQSFVEQRELGMHIPSFKKGLLDMLREAPDVIAVGELREPEVMRLTLNAAESGHLVIASLHATNAEDALYRLCNSFPLEAQEEIRFQVASTLAWVVVQQLIFHERFGFRVPLLSILKGNNSAKGMIRENKLPQIESAIQLGKNDGMFSMDRYFKEYLAPKDSFYPPAENFKPSEEASHEALYHSALLNGGAEPMAPKPEKTAAEDKSDMFFHPDEDAEKHFMIDEKATVDELIAQIRNSGMFKE